MCLLRKAAEAWEKLLNLRYDMVFGRKKKSYVVSLSFERYDFPHLVGMQYANDDNSNFIRKIRSEAD